MIGNGPEREGPPRRYGADGPWVVLLHGGPGAAGHMASLARRLAHAFRIVEPFQRRSGSLPLTVARHVADLHELIVGLDGRRPILVGSSWGAMLGLAYAAEHPASISGLVLIGCGTFDAVSGAAFRAELERRTTPSVRREVERIAREVEDPDERLRAMAAAILPLYVHDAAKEELRDEVVDAVAHEQTWADMLRLQREGVYPAGFEAITCPVLMLHGADDPHPGNLIRQSLEPHLPHLEYREWPRCGHYPWLERGVQEDVIAVLTRWMTRVGGAY
jgi:pimeloyl-ACP methyl ester carboxylesterase